MIRASQDIVSTLLDVLKSQLVGHAVENLIKSGGSRWFGSMNKIG